MPTDVTLTTGIDVVAPDEADQIVSGTSRTLNPSDSLEAGGGTDVLRLSGPGRFDLAGLRAFSGFEEVRLTNASASAATLVLRDGADLSVTLSDGVPSTSPYPGYSLSGGITVTLARSRVAVAGSYGSDDLYAATPDQLVAGSTLDGGAGYDSLTLSSDIRQPIPPGSVFDLTQVGLSRIEALTISGNGSFGSTATIVKADTASLKDVVRIDVSAGAELTTEAETLDLSGKVIMGVNGGGAITSLNAAGTIFTTDSAAAATLIVGGEGSDTVVVTDVSLTAAQRTQIFAGGIETIIDASGNAYSQTGTGTTAATLRLNDTADRIINDAEAEAVSFTVAGLGPDDRAVIIFRDEFQTLSASVLADGTSTVDLSTLGGTVTSTLIVIDGDSHVATVAGNSVLVDTQAPAAFLQGVSGQLNRETGHVLSGTLAASDGGLTLTVRDFGTVLGTTTSDAQGRFSFAFDDTKDGPNPTYALTATATDVAGNTGTSYSFVYTLDYTPNRPLFGDVITDSASSAGQIYALYDGLLGRTPDVSGWGSFVPTLNASASLHDLAESILTSREFTLRFGDVMQASDEAFVESLYRIALDRSADPVGYQNWLDELAAGTSRADVALGFAFSNENREQIAPAFQSGVFVPDTLETGVARLYYGLLDRAPDEGGQRTWTSHARAGFSLESIAQEFLNSLEYRNAHPGGQSDAQYVESLYDGALGRAPGAAEQHWLDALANGATRAHVALGVVESPDVQQHLVGKIEAGWHLV